MRLLLLFVWGLFVGGELVAQPAQWVVTNGAETGYDPMEYLTGYGISGLEGKSGEAIRNARDQALQDLSGKLKTQVEATSRLTESQEGAANFSSYQSDVKTMVSMGLGGVEKYEIGFDEGLNRQVALAVMDIRKMKAFLDTERTGEITRLDGSLSEVKDLAARNRPDLFQSSLTSFDLQLESLVQNLAIARLLGETIDPQTIVQRFYDARRDLVRDRLREKILTEKDLVKALVNAFPWESLEGKSVVLTNAVYKTSDISGQFFSYLRDDLADTLGTRFPGLKILDNKPDIQPDFILLGTYQEEGEGGYALKFKLQDTVKDQLAAPVFEPGLDAGFVRAQTLEFVPPNLQAAASDHDLQMAVFRQTVKTDLRVKASVGETGMTASEGTRFYFWVWVNRPGFINMVYTLAGENHFRVPLVVNYAVPPSQIARWVRVDQEFQVAPPFGTESAQFFFSVDKAPEFLTSKVQVDGQDYEVLQGDYGKLVMATRGLIRPDRSSDADQLKTDRTFTLNTVPLR